MRLLDGEKMNLLILISVFFSAVIFSDNQLLSGFPILLLVPLIKSESKKIGVLGVSMIIIAAGLNSNSFAWTGYWMLASSLIIMIRGMLNEHK